MSAVTWDDSELQAALGRLISEMPQKTQNCMQNACLAVEAQAKENCPAATGELRRSIQSEVEGGGTMIHGRVGTNTDYAIYVHEGTGIYSSSGAGRSDVPWTYYSDRLGHFVKTSGIKSTPFMADALTTMAPQIADYFMGVLEGA